MPPSRPVSGLEEDPATPCDLAGKRTNSDSLRPLATIATMGKGEDGWSGGIVEVGGW